VKYPFKPFDVRIGYLDGRIEPLFSRPAPDLLKHSSPENWFLISRDSADKTPEGPPFYASRLISDYDFVSGHARHFPIFTLTEPGSKKADQHILDFGNGNVWRANLSDRVAAYIKSLGYPDPDKDTAATEVIWLHALAIGFSKRYLLDNADGLTSDWPRIPLPDTRDALDKSAVLGRRLAALLDTENDVPGVIAGDVADHYRILGTISSSDLKVNAGWGHADKKGSVYPGSGKVVARDWTKAERDALEDGLAATKMDGARGCELLGKPVDVFLNGTTYWRAVPEQVWEFYIGGYQVIKKWLSYREESLLGRALTKDEAREVTGTIRRLAAIVLMADDLDENYIAIRDHAYPWQKTT
jgi:Type ISP C-terminal specificity domain